MSEDAVAPEIGPDVTSRLDKRVVVDEKSDELSVESPQDDDTEYVHGHPVIRNGDYPIPLASRSNFE